MQISFTKLDKELPTPVPAHDGDAGLDLFARETFHLPAGERGVIPTGIAVAIPTNYAGLVVPRSGLAAKQGIGIVNSPGLVDSGYRGELKVILVNHGDKGVTIERGDRIAQLVVVAVEPSELQEVDELPKTSRAAEGFGSTGR